MATRNQFGHVLTGNYWVGIRAGGKRIENMGRVGTTSTYRRKRKVRKRLERTARRRNRQ